LLGDRVDNVGANVVEREVLRASRFRLSKDIPVASVGVFYRIGVLAFAEQHYFRRDVGTPGNDCLDPPPMQAETASANGG
jgi:hypothetical protein